MATHYNRWSPDITHYLKPPYVKFGGHKSVFATRTPTKDDKIAGIYLQRLKLIKAVRTGGYSVLLIANALGLFRLHMALFFLQIQDYSVRLYVELSAPKVLFNNNFDELADGD